MKIFITVGTTEFDALIKEVNLIDWNSTLSSDVELRIQYGKGKISPKKSDFTDFYNTFKKNYSDRDQISNRIADSFFTSSEFFNTTDFVTRKVNNFESFYRYKSGILDDIEWADLVISHAGAGTTLEVLESGKKLISVVNDSLMHNHQDELANKFSRLGYCLRATPSTLRNVLTEISLFQPEEYTSGEALDKFNKEMEDLIFS